MKYNNLFLHALMCMTYALWGHEEETVQPPSLGNFSVPAASQIAPLIGFGQLIIGAKALLPQLSGSYARAHDDYTHLITPSVIYGIRDDLSLFLAAPFTPRSREKNAHAAGLEDMLLQGEYAFFSVSRANYNLQATVVANVQFPTGSNKKTPPTGNGSFTYFLGATFSFLSPYWYAFASTGADLTTQHDGKKFGNAYLYQWGFAKYIAQLSPKGWIFELMLEFDGTYTKKDKIHGATDPDSGGNTLLITPSIWLSSKRWIFQWGVALPLLQNLNGHQEKLQYIIAYNLGIAVQF